MNVASAQTASPASSGSIGKPAAMRAAVLVAAGAAELRDVAVPVPRSGEVLIRVEGCGVCGSNVPVWQGRDWFSYPFDAGAPGHEAWGVVERVGDSVSDVAIGDRVAALSYRAFAEYDIANADEVVRLPDALRDRPVPGEPLGCAWNVFARAGVEAGHTVAVVGIGFLGALLVQLAVAAGANVIALSRRRFALGTARRCGAHEAIRIEQPDVVAAVRELTSGVGCDVVIEAVGTQSALDVASGLPRERGRLVIAGYHQDGDRRVDMQSWNWRGLDVINAHERDPARYVDGMRHAVAALCDGRLAVEPLLTHWLPLAQLGTALDLAVHRPDGFLKAWVVC